MKAIEQYFYVVLFIMLYKVVLTFTSEGETLVCDHSSESYWTVLSCGTVYDAIRLIEYYSCPIHTVSLESDVQIIRVHCVCVFSREKIFLHRIPVTQWTCGTHHCIAVNLFGRRTCMSAQDSNQWINYKLEHVAKEMISVAKEVIKCSLQRTYLVVPYLKQCSPNPEERVLPSSHHSLKKKEQRSHIHALAYFSSKGKTKNAADGL